MTFSGVTVPLFEQKVIFAVCPREELDKYLLKYNDPLDTDERFFLKGYTAHIKEYENAKQTILVWVNSKLKPKEAELTFVHELFHAALLVLSWRGVIIIDESEEAGAYVYDTLYRLLRPKFDKAYARKGTGKAKRLHKRT
jgi:hypothetical protein